MSEGPPPPAPPRRWLGMTSGGWEIAAAVSIVALRLVLYPGDPWWYPHRDWLLWLSAYWIFTVLARRSRAWPVVTVLLVLVLSGIYLEGNLPITIETLRWNLWP